MLFLKNALAKTRPVKHILRNLRVRFQNNTKIPLRSQVYVSKHRTSCCKTNPPRSADRRLTRLTCTLLSSSSSACRTSCTGPPACCGRMASRRRSNGGTTAVTNASTPDGLCPVASQASFSRRSVPSLAPASVSGQDTLSDHWPLGRTLTPWCGTAVDYVAKIYLLTPTSMK